jgi:GST-like protein
MAAPIDLYTWKTSNGRKATIMFEELGVPYNLHPIDIMKGDQSTPDYARINPNQRIPAIIDPEGPNGKPYRVFESGALLMYLAEKFNSPLLPKDTVPRYDVIQWLMWQMGGVGPMFGQAHHFRRAAKEQVPYGIKRYTDETRRLWGVLDRRLGEVEYAGGGSYSIADIAIYPWCARYEWQGVKLEEFPNAKRWFDAISARPAVKRGMELPA